MRKLAFLIPVSLAACATTAPQPPVHGRTTGDGVCRQSSFEEFIGRVATSEVAAELLRASGARTVRWVRQGMVITMEYSEQRLTVRLDPNNRIITANCG